MHEQEGVAMSLGFTHPSSYMPRRMTSATFTSFSLTLGLLESWFWRNAGPFHNKPASSYGLYSYLLNSPVCYICPWSRQHKQARFKESKTKCCWNFPLSWVGGEGSAGAVGVLVVIPAHTTVTLNHGLAWCIHWLLCQTHPVDLQENHNALQGILQ